MDKFTALIIGYAILSGCVGHVYGNNMGWAVFGGGLVLMALVRYTIDYLNTDPKTPKKKKKGWSIDVELGPGKKD